MILYDIIFIIFSVFYIPFSILKKGKRGFNIRQRCGFGLVGHSSPTIWLHAVSVGEVMVLVQLIENIRNQLSAYPVVISVTTKAGCEAARRNFSQSATVVYSPLDLSFVVNRFFRLIRPKILVIVETEIWPNMLQAAKRTNVPAVIINGRISQRSFGRYKIASPFLSGTLKKIDMFCMQSEDDAARIIAIGAPKEKVKVTGNMKFDISLEYRVQSTEYRKRLGLSEKDILIVAGSTHKGEEEILLDVYRDLIKEFKNLKLLIAPRHINRIPQIKRCLAPFLVPGTFLLDTVGHLKDYYAIADIVFVGGSLVPHGGQNPIEPAYFSKPIIFGRYMFNFSAISRVLLKEAAAIKVKDKKELKDAIIMLLNDPKKAKAMGFFAKKAIEANRGASAKNFELIKSLCER